MRIPPTWPLQGVEAELPDRIEAVAAAIRGDGRKIRTRRTMPGTIALLYALRTSRNLDALAHLCRGGFASEAVGIVRAIAEDAVSLAYLADAPEDRAKDWAAFAEKRSAAIIAASGTAPEGSAWWSGKGPSAMARQLQGVHAQIGSEFLAMYWALCDDTHGNPLSANHYVLSPQDQDGLLTLVAGPSSHRVPEMCALGTVGATRLCAVAAELGVQLDMDAIQERAIEAAEPYSAARTNET